MLPSTRETVCEREREQEAVSFLSLIPVPREFKVSSTLCKLEWKEDVMSPEAKTGESTSTHTVSSEARQAGGEQAREVPEERPPMFALAS